MGGTPGQPQSAGQPQQPPPKHKAAEKQEKAEKQQKRPQTPFHHRSAACEDPPLEPDAPTARLGLRPALLRPADAPPAAKAPQLHGGGAAELPGSPQPPPLSPHPCERGDEGGEAKNPATPHSQHFYPPASEPCPPPPKGPEDPRLDALAPPFHPAYPEPQEPAVYVGAAVGLEEDGGRAPWRFFLLPRRKEAEFPTPQLPGDKLRDDAAGGPDSVVSVTE